MHKQFSHSFRADIAGLRAVAVLPILLFHAGLSVLGGGFVGVDIFFVISGFLITSIIVRDLSLDRFSMLEFYRRRAARIFPALALVLATTLLAGAIWMLPSEVSDLGISSAAAAAFVSNFHFMLTTDYFGGAAEAKPLLHTWSLAVEEQFYVFYPILMIVLWKWFRRWLVPAIVVVCLVSFGLALVLGRILPEAAFYMFPARAWELGLGALVALGVFPSRFGDRVKHGLAGLGLAMILVGIFTIRPDTLFPAPGALLPVVGAVLLIAYGQTGPTAAILSWRPMVWIGDISYSLYLWHWPIITFYRLQTGVELDGIETVALVAASIAAAALTRVILEEPARKRLAALPRLPVVVGGTAALLAIAVASWASAERPMLLHKVPPEVVRIAEVVNYRDTVDYKHQFRKGVCSLGEDDPQTFNRDCVAPDPVLRNWVIFGDSHAGQYWRALQEYWSADNVIKATASGCRPLVDPVGPARCTVMVSYVLEELLRPDQVHGVVFAGRWREQEIPRLITTVRMIKARGIEVVILGPTVEYDGDFPLIVARAIISDNPDGVAHRMLRDRVYLDRSIAAALAPLEVTYISQFDAECPDDQCTIFDQEGDPIHFDYGHLTLSGARLMLSRFKGDLPD